VEAGRLAPAENPSGAAARKGNHIEICGDSLRFIQSLPHPQVDAAGFVARYSHGEMMVSRRVVGAFTKRAVNQGGTAEARRFRP